MSNTKIVAQTTVPSQPSVATDSGARLRLPPATPRVMPVYLPGKEAKAPKTYHDRTSSLPADLTASVLSGSDTERTKRRELVSIRVNSLPCIDAK